MTLSLLSVIDAESINHEVQDLDGRPIVLPRRARGTLENDTAYALSLVGQVEKYEYYGDLVVVKLGKGWYAQPCGEGVELHADGECVCTVPFACTHIRF